jgi:photosystem II stability/assembly factor-like uncharacterized protein
MKTIKENIKIKRNMSLPCILFIFFLLYFPVNILFSQQWTKTLEKVTEPGFSALQKAFNDYWSDKTPVKGSGWKQFKRWEWFWEQRLYPDSDFPNAIKIYDEVSRLNEKSNKDLPLMKADWHELGPFTVPENKLGYKSSGLGRISCIRFHPNNGSIIFVGASTGGVWISYDFGKKWFNVPMTDFSSIGISDIAICDSKPTILYAATGDVNYYYSTRGYSIGVIKSTDGGQSWKVTDLARTIQDNSLISRVLVRPDNANVVIAATSSGIYKSTDGGNKWELKSSNFFARDLEFMPNNYEVVYSCSYSLQGSISIYKSTDCGSSWRSVRSFIDANRIKLATTKNDPNMVYALCSKASTNGFGGFYVSTDAGENWSLKSSTPNILNIETDGSGTDGQGNYDLALAVSPVDKNLIFSGGIHIWKSTNGGETWSIVNHWYGANDLPFVHADQHTLVFHPLTKDIFSGNDGGIYYTKDLGKTWVDISNGLAITQYYRLGASASNPKLLLGGTQDNGTFRYYNDAWYEVNGADGMECMFDYKNSSIAYSTYYYGQIFRSVNGGMNFSYYISPKDVGESGGWVTPYLLHPKDPGIMYIGYRDVWEISNNAKDRKKISDLQTGKTLNALAVSPSDPTTIYASTWDKLYATYNHGDNWQELFNPNPAITYITVDPQNPKRVWVSLSGYTQGEKVFEYDGVSWTNISGNLPNIPVNCVIYQKNSNDMLYIATDIGVYYKNRNMNDWVLFNDGMPNITVNELEIQYGSGRLIAATYGRGMWATPIIDCNLPKPQLIISGETEFCMGDSVKLSAPEGYKTYKWSNGDTIPSIFAKFSDKYFVTITDDKGCIVVSDTVEVKVYNLYKISISPIGRNPVCDGDSLILSAGVGFQKYEWSDGRTGRRITVKNAGNYIVKGTTVDGCVSVSDTFKVKVNPIPNKPEIQQQGKMLISTNAISYQWYLNGEPIDGAIAQSYEIKDYGKYYVKVINEDSCSNYSEELDVTTEVGSNFTANPSLNFDFNKKESILTINYYSNKSNSIRIEIFNLLGNKLFSEEKSSNNFFSQKISLGNYPSGIYFIIINISGKIYFEKIVL